MGGSPRSRPRRDGGPRRRHRRALRAAGRLGSRILSSSSYFDTGAAAGGRAQSERRIAVAGGRPRQPANVQDRTGLVRPGQGRSVPRALRASCGPRSRIARRRSHGRQLCAAARAAPPWRRSRRRARDARPGASIARSRSSPAPAAARRSTGAPRTAIRGWAPRRGPRRTRAPPGPRSARRRGAGASPQRRLRRSGVAEAIDELARSGPHGTLRGIHPPPTRRRCRLCGVRYNVSYVSHLEN